MQHPAGTESNIQALRLAKVVKKEVVYPNIVVPESAHFSFRKASDLLCLEMRTVPLDGNFRMDAQKAAEQIDRKHGMSCRYCRHHGVWHG